MVIAGKFGWGKSHYREIEKEVSKMPSKFIFTGFVIPTPKMLGWSRWINYINPVGYVFESLMVNDLHGMLNIACNIYDDLDY